MVQLVGSSSLGLGKLIDGKNQFVHIRYSANADGSNMTIEIQADTKYIGIATNSSETAPTSPSDYSWGRFVGTSGTSSYTWIRYSSNEDGSNMTTTTNEETKYIGVAITSENSAPTDHTKYSWALFKGEDGRGVKKTEVSYQKSTSGTVIPTGSWSASIPSVSDGEYLWTRTLFTYTDGTTTSTYNVSRNGISGLGIARADVHYQKSTSGTTVPIGTWTVTIPAVEANEYLWTRTTITYTDDSTSVSYSVGKMGADGKDAQLLYLTATSEIQAFDSDDKPKTTQPITISAKLQNASGTATFVAIPYIGNTAQTPITLGGTGNDRTLLPSQWTDPKWTIIAITATLGSLTDTVSIHKLKDGQNGADGADGSPGVGVESATITYAASTSGTVHPTGGWSETIPSVPSGQYLWTRTVWLYTNGMSETSYSVSMMGERGPQGPKGDQGNDGVAGKDGVGVRSTVITYGLSDSDTTQPTSWSAQVPTLTKGKYLWTKTVWSYTDSTSETSYQKTYIARDGNDGTDGLPGKDGVGIRSTTITYAVSESGTTKPVGGWSTTVPTVPSGQYLWTRTVWTYTDDTSETGYSVAKMGERGPQGPQGLQGIQGPKGDQGIAGPTGADGLTSYTHIAYANSADGTKDFSVSDSNRIYIGVYVDFNATDSTSPSSYQWSLIKGADGADGAPGKPGADGRTPYFHTAYANSADGSSGFSTTDSNGKLYLGTCTDYTQADPTDYRAYTWVKIKGEQGPQGIQGPSGANGQSLYTWLKYADDANGSGMSEAPDGKKYIGLAYNRPIPTESSNPEDYTWSLIQGENGVNGIDGKTYYTWVKYADTSTGGGLSDNPTGKKYIGLAYNKTTPTESSNPGDYQWALIKGDKGDRGDDGLPGKDGVGLKSTVITYGLSDSETTQPSSWAAQVPTLTKGKYLWTKTVWTYTDNTTETGYQKTYIARDGNNGADGLPGKDGVGIANTTVQYAQSTSGTTKPTSGWSTTIPAVASGNYLWTKTTWTYTDGTSESGYSVAKMGERGPQGPQGLQGIQGIQGPKGDQGVKGATGADGKSSYTHIAYANSADGRTDFSVSDYANKSYIGIYVDNTAIDSTDPAKYNWTLIKGADGAQGIPGKPGADGRTPYFHTAWADSSDGRTGFSTTVSLGKKYLGTYTDFTSTDSTDPSKYNWTETSNAIEQEIAYAWSEDGKDRFTRVKPEPNIARLYSLLDWGTTVDGVPRSQVTNLNPTNVSSNEQRYTRNSTSNAYLLTSSQNTADYSGMTDRSRTSYANYRIGDKILFSFDYKGPNNGVHVVKWRMSLDGSKITRKYIGTTTYRATLPDGYTRVWAYITVNEGDIDYAFEISSGFFGSAVGDSALIRNLQISKGNATDESIMPIYTTNPQDDYDNSTPRYIGRSLKDSTNPADFTWEPNPERKPWTAYAQGLNGEGFSLMPYGENFIRNSDFRNRLDYWTGSTSSFIISQESGDNLVTATITGQNSVGVKVSLFGTTIPVKPNDYIIISGWFRGKAIESNYFFIAEAYNSGGGRVQYADITTNSTALIWSTPVADNTWSKFYLRWKITNADAVSAGFRYAPFHNGTYSYKKWKLEADTPDGKPTPWTPAPSEDPLGAIPKYVGTAALPYTDYTKYAWTLNTDYTQDQIDQANENISNKVDQGAYDQDKSVIYDDISKKLDDEEFREFQKIMNELKGSYDSFVGEGGRYEQELKNSLEREQAIVKEFGNKVNQLNFINTYIRESEEGLVIGAKNSPMQMLLSKDSLSFMDGGQTVAYFSNQSFYINRGAVVESLQVGVHKLTKVGNEHTVIQYIPQ